MADFLAELSGESTDSLLNYKWAKGKEKWLLEKFKKEMYTVKSHEWINLSENTTEYNSPMQGYWVG